MQSPASVCGSRQRRRLRTLAPPASRRVRKEARQVGTNESWADEVRRRWERYWWLALIGVGAAIGLVVLGVILGNNSESNGSRHSYGFSSEAPRYRSSQPAAHRRRHRRRHHHQPELPARVAALTVQLYRDRTGIERQQFQLAYEICGSQPQSQSAEEWNTSNDPSSIAHAFGLEYREPVRAAIEEGCLRAFADSTAQWEAEVEAFGQL
jgi:hypothetical protein